MKKNRQTQKEGMALVVAVMFISVSLIAVASLAMRMVNADRQVSNYIDLENCMYGINSGLSESFKEIKAGRNGNIGIGMQDYTWDPNAASDPYSQGEDPFANTTPDDGAYIDFYPAISYLMEQGLLDAQNLDLSINQPRWIPDVPGLRYVAIDIDWGSDGIDNDGDGLVDLMDDNEEFHHTIYAISGVESGEKDKIRIVEVMAGGRDVSVWNNAIFAGGGAAGGCINGNVSMHGSVHILGDNIPVGGDAVIVVDLSGGSLIHNYYQPGAIEGVIDGDPVDLATCVPPISTTEVNGEEDQRTLFAELRVKHGLVSVSGSSEVGNPDTFGNGVKDLMDGIYNTDGWSGNQTIDDGGRGDPKVVYSDNGWDELYDLGSGVPFPHLTDPWQWPYEPPCSEFGAPYPISDIGMKEPANASTDSAYVDADGYYTHEGYYSDKLSDGDSYVGDVLLDAASNDKVYINLTQQEFNPDNYAPVLTDNAACIKGDDYLYYDPEKKVLEIQGQIVIEGNFTTNQQGGDDTIYYMGKGSLLVHGNGLIDTNMISCNGITQLFDKKGKPDGYEYDTANSFPVNNCLGVMFSGNLVVGISSQISMLGAYYAEGMIKSSKQTTVMGTFVSTYFDMGTNVPDIYQIPTMPQNLPIGMIGMCPILNLQTVSWRELSMAPAGE